ncbi:putative F-box only protein [Dioscorea sansibarensis]
MAAKPARSQWEPCFNWLPDDIAIAIAVRLEVWDVCSLGSCSRFWRALCASDCLWFDLCRKRWPALSSDEASSSAFQGWRSFYINNHRKMAIGASSVIKFVEECSQNKSLEVGYYLRALRELCSMEVGFKDVQLFLFTRKSSALLNLIGLHYSILSLGIPHNDVIEALQTHHIAERQVCVKWFKLGRWFYGFRLPDESRSRKITLRELATSKEEPILAMLDRGVIHEVLRVQITQLA